MKVLHLLASGSFGGIETLIRDYSYRSKLHNLFVFVWEKGPVFDDMEEKKIPCIYMGEKQGYFLHTVKNILKICKQEKPDVLVAHHAAPQFKVVIFLLSIFSPTIKTLAYAHANGEDIAKNGNTIKSYINRKIHEIGFKRAGKILAISEFVEKSIVNEFFISSNKITVIYNAIDVNRFSHDIREHMNKPVKLIYVGRLVKEKGVQNILSALKKLPKQSEWVLDIVGDGIYRKKLAEKVCALNLTDKVNFLGSRNDIPELLQSHDIFIHMPVCQEGFGITVIEAMAAGLVCICGNKGGIPEVIENGVDGILIQTEAELSNIIKSIVENPNQHELFFIRKQAMEKANQFNMSSFVEQLDKEIIGMKVDGNK